MDAYYLWLRRFACYYCHIIPLMFAHKNLLQATLPPSLSSLEELSSKIQNTNMCKNIIHISYLYYCMFHMYDTNCWLSLVVSVCVCTHSHYGHTQTHTTCNSSVFTMTTILIAEAVCCARCQQ